MSLQRKLQLLIASVFFSTLLLGSFLLMLITSIDLGATDELSLIFGVVILLLLSIAGAAMVYYVLGIVLGPLEELSSSIEKGFSPQEKIEIPEDIKYLNNEIGVVARAIDEITTKAHQQYESLEQKVQRRTKAMEESKAKDEAIIKNIAEGLVVTDMDRKIMFVNTAAENMLGYKLFEIFERVWPDFLLVKDKRKEEIPLDKLAITKAIKHGKATKAEISDHSFLMRKNGMVFPVLISAAPINVGDQRLGAVIVFRDVTKVIEVDNIGT